MKKFLGLFIVLTLITAMFVSCSSDVDESREGGICSISFDVGGTSKNIMATVNMNMATSGTDAFYWQYEAKKIDEYGKVGQTSGRVRMKESGKGLPDVLYDFSSGKWLFSMYAYLDENFQDQVYDGSKEIILSPAQENRISIPMKRSQIAGDFGTLYINSDNISIAVEAKSVYVNNVASDTNWQDEQADKKVFGKLSDYSFQVAFCDEDWEVQNTFISTTNMESYSTQCSLELEPGVYYVRTKIFQNEQNEAVTYISYNAVSIYSNCVTTLQDSTNGDGYDGINMKRVKEYKIEYYDCSTTSSNAPFSGVHQWIIIRGNDGEGDEHIKWWTSHEYGRSETLDEPTKEGLGFAGYYEEPNPSATAIPLTTIKSTVYKDIKLYAKWDTINYKTISWDENWPIKSTGSHTAYTNGSTSGGKDDVYTLRTAPVCQGYIFKGWYTESAPDILIVADSGFPKPTKHDQVVSYKAKWEPVKYSIKFNLNRANNGTDSTAFAATNPNANINNCIYDEVYEVKDAVSTVKGFMGWSKEKNWTTGMSNLLGMDGTLKNLTEVDGSTVTLYAVWNDMYTPLEYIRSYPSSADSGPYIDTGLKHGTGAGYWTDIDMTIEWAGEPKVTAEVFAGSMDTTWDIGLCAISKSTSIRDGKWRIIFPGGSSVDDTGLFFEDEKIDVKGHAGADGFYMMANGETVSRSSSVKSATGTQNLYLFAGNNKGSVNWCSDIRLYSCELYNSNNVIERKFVPCKVKTAITDSNKAKYASDNSTHSVGEIGLWDLKTNKFYPAKIGSFLEPDNEWSLTLNANGGNGTNRVQRMKKSTSEKVHKCIFSKQQSEFLGWMAGTSSDSWDPDRVAMTLTANTTRYAKWSVKISRDYFEELEWIESTGKQGIDTGYTVSSNDTVIHYLKAAVMSGQGYNYTSLYGSYNGKWDGYLTYNASGWMTAVPGESSKQWNVWGTADKYYQQAVEYKVNMVNKSSGNSTFQVYVNGVSAGTVTCTKPAATGISMYLFGLHTNSGLADVRGGVRMWYFTTEVNGKNVRQFVPCKLKVKLSGTTWVNGGRSCPAGEIGMWDLVNNKFYPNFYQSDGVYVPFNTPSTFLVRFDANGGIGKMENQIFSAAARLNPCTFKRTGYEFIGWCTVADGSGGTWFSDNRILRSGEYANMTLYAQWRQIPATVCYEQLEKIWNDTDETHAYINTGFKPKKAQGRVIYTYGRTTANSYKDSMLGAAGNSTGKTANGSLTIGDKTIAVTDSAVGSVYNIDVYWNGSRGRADISGVYSASDYAATFANATGNMYLFADSATSVRSYGGNELYSMKIYDDKDMLVRDFVPCVLTRAITAAEDADSIARTKGTVGLWDKCTNKFYGNVDTTGGYFVTNNKVSIIFDGNGATSGKMDILTAEVGESITLTANAYSRSDGARFIGWNTEANGTGIWYSNKYETNTWTGGGHKLYAQWESRYGALDLEYFEPVNYVKSTGVQYIDTLWTHPANKNFKITLNANFLSGSGGYGVNGADTNTTTKAAQFCIALGASGYNREWSQAVTNANLKVGTRHLYVLDPAGECVWIDGTKTTHTAKGIAAGMANHYLFAYAQTNGTPVYAEVEVYNYKVEEGSVVKKNFIPCRLIKNINMYYAGRLSADEKSHDAGVLGFWDTVENKFYGNAGTSTFVCEKN